MEQVHSTALPNSPRSVSAVNLDDDPRRQGSRKTAARPKTQKTVAFELDEASFQDNDTIFGKVKCQYGPVRPELTPEEYSLLYWKKKHFKTFKKDSKKLARTTDHPQVYVDILLDIYAHPPDKERNVGVVPIGDTQCLPLAMAATRGLERYVFPGLLQDQARLKESVLKAQCALPETMDANQKEVIVASTSLVLSRQSRHLARVMGHADSIVALRIYQSTFLPPNNPMNDKEGT